MDFAESTIAVAVHNGWVAPCLSGVELHVFRAPPGGKAGAAAETACEAFSTAGWRLPDWARQLHARDVDCLICSAADPFLTGMLAGYGITVLPGSWGSADEAPAQLRRGCVPAVPMGPMRGGRGRRRRCGRGGGPPWAGLTQPWPQGRGRGGGASA